MHSRRIIHRDLKPDNVILKDEDTIEVGLVDLGFATFEADYDKLFKRCGTPGYVAPEILADQPYDCKVDIFSCGVILYILLTGRVPFYGKSLKEIVKKNTEANINFAILKKENFSKSTISLLKGMLEKNPSQRISAKEALNHECF